MSENEKDPKAEKCDHQFAVVTTEWEQTQRCVKCGIDGLTYQRLVRLAPSPRGGE